MRIIICFVVFLFSVFPVWAHHPGGGAESTQSAWHGVESISFGPLMNQARVPRTRSDLTFTADWLDEDRGELLSWQIQGEYSLNKRVSVGGRLPLMIFRETNEPNSYSPGDMGLFVKGKIGGNNGHRLALLLSNEITLPTGNEHRGLGAGAVTFIPTATLMKEVGKSTLFVSGGGAVEVAHGADSAVSYAAGAILPILGGKHPVRGLLVFEGHTLTADESFETGSTRCFVRPGLILNLRENLLLTLAGRIGVVDSFQEQHESVEVTTESLGDVTAGFLINLGYAFD